MFLRSFSLKINCFLYFSPTYFLYDIVPFNPYFLKILVYLCYFVTLLRGVRKHVILSATWETKLLSQKYQDAPIIPFVYHVYTCQVLTCNILNLHKAHVNIRRIVQRCPIFSVWQCALDRYQKTKPKPNRWLSAFWNQLECQYSKLFQRCFLNVDCVFIK